VISAEAIVIVFSFFPIEKNVRGAAAERSVCPRIEEAAVKASEGADAWRASGLASTRWHGADRRTRVARAIAVLAEALSVHAIFQEVRSSFALQRGDASSTAMALRNLLSRPLARQLLDQACRRSAITHGQPITRSSSSGSNATSKPARRALSPFEQVMSIQPRTTQPTSPPSVAPYDRLAPLVAASQLPGGSLCGKRVLVGGHYNQLATSNRPYSVATYDRLPPLVAASQPPGASLCGKRVLVGGHFSHVTMHGKKMNQTMVKELLERAGAKLVTQREADKGVPLDFLVVGKRPGEKIMTRRTPENQAVRLTELLPDLVEGDEPPLHEFDLLEYHCRQWNEAMVRNRPAFSLLLHAAQRVRHRVDPRYP
jgi:hypothetical protein